MYHIFFIHSSVDGHLCGFHVLAAMKIAVLQWKLGCMCHFGSCFSPDLCPRVGMHGHMVALFLGFKETFIQFSIVAVSIYIPTSSIGGFPSLHIVEPLLISGRQEQIINASLFSLHFTKLLRWSCENPESIRGPLEEAILYWLLFLCFTLIPHSSSLVKN